MATADGVLEAEVARALGAGCRAATAFVGGAPGFTGVRARNESMATAVSEAAAPVAFAASFATGAAGEGGGESSARVAAARRSVPSGDRFAIKATAPAIAATAAIMTMAFDIGRDARGGSGSMRETTELVTVTAGGVLRERPPLDAPVRMRIARSDGSNARAGA